MTVAHEGVPEVVTPDGRGPEVGAAVKAGEDDPKVWLPVTVTWRVSGWTVMAVETVWLSTVALTSNDPALLPLKVVVAAPFTYKADSVFRVPEKVARPSSVPEGRVVPLLSARRSAVTLALPPTLMVPGDGVISNSR